MGDLDDQLRRLADRRAERTPTTDAADAALSATGHAARRWPYVAAAAVVLMAGLAITLATRDDAGVDTLDGEDLTQHIVLDELGIEFDIPADWAPAQTSTTEDYWEWAGDRQDGVSFSLIANMPGDDGPDGAPADPPSAVRSVDVLGVVGQVFEYSGADRAALAVIVNPLLVGGTPRGFVMWSSVDNVERIAPTLGWIEVEPAPPTETMVVEASDFGVRLTIPAHWEPIEAGRTWGADDGWIAVDVLASADPADFIAAGELGDDAEISSVVVMGLPATLVTSAEPVALDFGTFRVGGAIVVTPEPVSQHDELWDQIVIGGDVDHLAAILASAEWIGVEADRIVREIDAPDPEADYDLVAATPAGIELRRRISHEVDLIPGPSTQVAFVLGDNNEYLVSETTDSGTSSIRIRRGDEDRELDLAVDEYHFAYLRDAATVDGRPTALIQIRRGLVGPTDTFEELRLVDLETEEMTTLSNENVWEEGVSRGFLADGAIVLEWGSLGDSRIDVIDYDGTELWSTVVDESANQAPHGQLVVSEVAAQWTRIEENSDGSVEIHQDLYEIATGDFVGALSRRIDTDSPPRCHTATRWILFICSTSFGDVPLQIDLELGTVTPIPGLSTGVVTAAHTASRAFGERHPCGLGEPGFEPHDFLVYEPVELDDGRTMNVGVWSPDGTTLVVQGFLPDWRTNRIELFGGYIEGTGDDIAVTGPSEPFDATFFVFAPDTLFTEAVPTGYVTAVEFDGCDLVVTSSGIVN